jgi:tight adherence protein C
MFDQLLMIACIVGAVGIVAFFASRLLIGKDDSKLRRRLASKQTPSASEVQEQSAAKKAPILQKIGTAAAKPFMPKTREKQSAIRRNLGYAGIYAPSAPKAMTGAKVILLFGGLLGGYLMGLWADNLMLGLSLGGLVGYMLPTFWLKGQIKKNRQELSLGLPDTLDLMVVCVEAGLTIDAAMQRVGQELAIAHPRISRELGITHMETRVGVSRFDALKNFSSRTGSPAIQSVVAMLSQADKFGTSIADALRVQAESLRVKRQMAAEEMAAKASVKMTFPLVLFIFPSTFIILAGPSLIGLMNSPMFKG